MGNLANYLNNVFSPFEDDEDEDTRFGSLVQSAAQRYGLAPSLINRIIQAESSGNPQAVSPVGARGLMQLTPETGAELGLLEDEDFYDPAKNIDAGARYYRMLLDKYEGDHERALAAYNWGMGNLDRKGIEYAPPETRAYIDRVLNRGQQPDGGGQPIHPTSPLDDLFGPGGDEKKLTGSPVVDRVLKGQSLRPQAQPGLDPKYRKGLHRFGGPDPDAPGHVTGVLAGTGIGFAGLVELAAMIVPGELGESAEKVVRKSVVEPLEKARVDYLAAANPDSKMKIKIPGELTKFALDKRLRSLGDTEVSFSELARLAATGSGEIVDILLGVGHAGLRGVYKIARSTGMLKKAGLADEAVDEMYDLASAVVERGMTPERMNEIVGKYVHWAESYHEATNTGNWLRRFANRMIFHFSEKEAAVTGLSKTVKRSVQRMRNAGAISESPILKEVGIWSDKDGWRYLGPSLHQITNRVDKEVLKDIDTYMAFERLFEDILPRNRSLSKTISKIRKAEEAGKISSRAAAREIKNLESKMIEGITDETLMEGEQIMAALHVKYGRPLATTEGGLEYGLGQATRTGQRYAPAPQTEWNEFYGKVQEIRRWYRQATLDQLLDIGVIDSKQYKRLLETGRHYASWFKVTEDWIEKFGPKGAIAELREAEAEDLARISAQRAGRIKSKPISRLHRAIGSESPIISPIQSMIIRAQRLNQYMTAQRVRNSIGDAFEHVLKEGFGKNWVKIPVHKRNYHEVGRLRNQPEAFSTWKEGKETIYLTRDPEMVQALETLNAGQASLLNKLVKAPVFKQANFLTRVFRGGVVLGQEFIIRNPIRDQLMAGVMSKFGYIPGFSFVRGLMHVIGKTDTYHLFHQSGAGTANFVSQDINRLMATVDDLTRPLTTSERKFLKSRLARIEGASPLERLPGGGVQRARNYLSPQERARLMARLHEQRTGSAMSESVVRSVRNALSHERAAADAGLMRKTVVGGKNTFGGLLYFFQKTSETLEEATRVGAFAKAVRRQKKGKGYAFLPALDMAVGGLAGYGAMVAKVLTGGLYNKFSFTKAAERFSKLRRTVDRGGVVDWSDFMDEGREITLDYRRAGYTGEIFNSFYAFANAELQDISRFYRAMRDQPINTIVKAFSFITVPAVANWYMNFDHPLHSAQSDSERALFYHPTGYNQEHDKFFRLPKPIGLAHSFWGLAVEKFLDWAAWNDPDTIRAIENHMWPGRSDFDLRSARNDVLKRLHQMKIINDPLIEMRNKVGGDPDALRVLRDEFQDTSVGRFASQPWPTAMQGVANVMQNWDPFFETKPVPRRFTGENAPLPEDIKLPTTSPIEEQIASVLRKVPIWGLQKTNPLQVRHILSRTFGSLGQHAVQAVDELAQATGAFDKRPGVPKDITDRPLIKAFWGRPLWGSGSDPVEDFYRLMEDASAARNSILDRLEAADKAGAEVVLDRNPEWVAAKFMAKTARQLSEINKVHRLVRQDRRMSDVERADKLMQLDQVKTLIADSAVKVYRYMLENPGWMTTPIERFPLGADYED